MKQLLKKTIVKSRLLFDVSILVFVFFSAIILKIYKLLGVKNLTLSTKLIRKIGIYPIRNHYYEPQFIHDHIIHKFNKKRKIDKIFNYRKSDFKILNKLRYSNEIKNLKLNEKNLNNNFNIRNPFFSEGDAEFLYQFIRHTKPKRIIEIGSGFSTLIAYQAKLKNDKTRQCEITCIDPNIIKIISKLKINHIKKKIEDIKLDKFRSLEKNDLLFIDSTHIIKPYGDVLKIYLEIIPSLKKNVNICIHDIFTPFSYPEDWVVNHNIFWNEQFLLEAILMDKKKYKTLAPLYFLKKESYKEMKKICPYLNQSSSPTSYYIKKIN